MNLSGIQAQLASDAFKQMVRATWPYTLKILDGARDDGLVAEWVAARIARGGGLLILRLVTSDSVTIAELPALTDRALAAFAGWQRFAGQGITVVLELPINEKFTTEMGQFADLAEASVSQAQKVKDAGFVPGVLITSEGNPSDGNPSDPYGALFFLQPRVLTAMRAFRQMGALWCPHGYSHPPAVADEQWHFNRPYHILNALPEDAQVNYAFGEMGCDGGCALPDKKPGVGWQGYFDPDQGRIGRYAVYARVQVQTMVADPRCLGGAFFLSGADPSGQPNFLTFDIGDEVDFRPVLTEEVPSPPRRILGPLPEEPLVPPTTQTMQFADVSNYQGTIDMSGWKAAGIEGVIIRLSEDGSLLDAFGAANWRQAKACGLLRAAYHVCDPRFASPVGSLARFGEAIIAAGGLEPGDGIVADIELGNPGDQSTWMAEWGAGALTKFGGKAMLYSAPWWMKPHGLEIAGVAEQFSGLWDASYTGDPDARPPHIPGWDKLVMVQWTANGSLPGVLGNVDLDEFLGGLNDWLALGVPAAWPAADQPVEPPSPPTVDNAWREANVWAPLYTAANGLDGMPGKTAFDQVDVGTLRTILNENKARRGA